MNQTPRKSVGLPLKPTGPAAEGKNGHGAASAMTQIARDRVAAARAAPLTADAQIRGLWRLRVPEDRTIDGLWTLRTWLLENAPEVLNGKGYKFQHLLALLSDEMTTGAGQVQVRGTAAPT